MFYLRYLPMPQFSGGTTKALEFNTDNTLRASMLILFVILSAIMTDTGAYFVGVFFGKHKMNERISPKKTWEGFFGGIILTSIFISGFALIFAFTGHPLLPGILDVEHMYHIFILSLIIPLVSTLGDLVFSSIKRHYQIKDFSNILPGHGGILDRLDSLIFAGITAAIYISIFANIANPLGGSILP